MQFRRFFVMASFVLALGVVASYSAAQYGPPGGEEREETVEEFISKMMAFNKAKDGKLTRAELTDTRLHPLFDRADTKKNGYLTRADLEAVYAKENAGSSKGPGFGDFPGKKGPPPLGQVLPPFVRDALELTDAQRQQLDALQKEVQTRLDKILTEEQRKRLGAFSPKGPPQKKGPPPGTE